MSECRSCVVSSNSEVLALPAETAGKVANGFTGEEQRPLEIKWTIAVGLSLLTYAGDSAAD